MSNSSLAPIVERAIKWLPQAEVGFACADISFAWRSERNGALVVVMHFSRVVGGHSDDLEIVFGSPLATKWEEESFGLIECPHPVPRLELDRWTFPTLIIEDSHWRKAYVDRRYAENDPQADEVVHYFLSSMNDLVHVLAHGEPVSRWIPPAS